MSRMRGTLLVLVAATSLMLASCVESKHPLSDPNTSAHDRKLIGTWRKDTPADRTELLVVGRDSRARWVKGAPVGLMSSCTVEWDASQALSAGSARTFFPSTIGEETYLNYFDSDKATATVKIGATDVTVWKPENIEKYRLMKYRVTGDVLEVWEGNEEAVAKAVESGKVRGEVKRDKEDPKQVASATLTDTTPNLARYIKSGGGNVLFPDSTKQTYRRIK